MAFAGEFLTLSSSEWPSAADVCFLSDVLETSEVPQRYYLSPTACQGILSRAERRGKPLPSQLDAALRAQAGLSSSATPEATRGGGGVGPLEQEDVSATLATNQDQTLFTKGECLTPWDVQSKRIYAETQCGPSLQSGTGEGMNIQPCIAISTANTGANGSNVNLEGTSYTLDLANSNAVAFVQNSRDEVRVQGDGTLSGALAANEGVKQRTYVALGTMHQNQAGEVVVSDGISGTITSNSSVSRQNLPVCMASDNSKAAVDENLAGTLHVGGAAPMVTCMSDTQAHASVDEECCGTLTSRMFKDAPVVGGMVVRRLTPMECERLQGFKDGYTDIHVKCTRTKDGGYKAVEVEETPDTPRYKALGNSMAVPCMRWIGERIQEQEERRTA